MASGKKSKSQRKRPERSATLPPAGRRSSPFPVENQPSSRRFTFLALTMMIAIGLLIYGNSFNGPFLYDDLRSIVDNPFIRLTRISATDLTAILKSPSPRPFANLTFALNYYVHQYHVVGYHLVNVAIHLINAFLVFLLARLTLGLCGFQKTWIALPVALLWLVNPVHTQSVTYIVQRMSSLATLFYLLSLVCYIRGRLSMREDGASRRRPSAWVVACVLAGVLGLLSKQIAATLPVTIFLYEWYFFQNLDGKWFKKQARWIGVILLIMIAVGLIYLNDKQLAELNVLIDKHDFTLAQRLLTQPGVALYYLSLLAFPFPDRLRAVYQIAPATGFISPVSTLPALIALVGLITAAIVLSRRQRLTSFAIVWFLTALTIESSIIPLALVFEHRTYLPSVFLFIALGPLLFQNITAPKALALTCLTVILCGFGTRQRNVVWTDAVAFWSDAVRKTPFEETYNALALEMIRSSRPKEAIPLLGKAIDHDPEFYKAYCNLGIALHELGRTKEAETALFKALDLDASYAMTHNNLGLIRIDQGRLNEATDFFQKALALAPHLDIALGNLGVVYFKKGDLELALTYFNKALSLNPHNTDAFDNLNKANRALEKNIPIIDRLKQEQKKRPNDPKIICQMAAVYQRSGMTGRAVDLFEEALRLDPTCEICLDFLARTYWQQNRYDRAAETLERQARLYPETPDIFYGLASVYAKNNQTEQAVKALKQAVARGFNDMDVLRKDPNMAGIRETDYYRFLTGGRVESKGFQQP